LEGEVELGPLEAGSGVVDDAEGVVELEGEGC